MGHFSRFVLIGTLTGLQLTHAQPETPADKQRFYPDDPILVEPEPLPVTDAAKIDLDDSYDQLQKSFFLRSRKGPATRARSVNTLDEVPDNAWYQNRLGHRQMSLEELARGPTRGNSPQDSKPWVILSVKTDGVTPGLNVRDSEGRRYVMKFDNPTSPRLTTAVDVIGSKIFHALGYNVPENYIVRFRREDLRLGEGANFTTRYGVQRAMEARDIDDFLREVFREQDGTYRAMASLFVSGKLLGPFLYEGTRSDDPNDIVPHEDRRELRGLHVFAAWLNHYDTTALNTLDSLVDESGRRYIRHYLIDFGSIMGSGGTGPRRLRYGYLYEFDFKAAALDALTLGLRVPDWVRAEFAPSLEGGRFEAATFDPRNWKPIYPNPAFLRRLPDDNFWAAKKVLAFRDGMIRAVVETGEYRDAATVDWIAKTLIDRRDRIGRAFLEDVLPLDDFEVRGGQLEFEDLAVKYGFRSPRQYQVHWSLWDNDSGEHSRLDDAMRSFQLPTIASVAEVGTYLAAHVRADDPRKTVTVFVRKETGGFRIVGVERSW